MKRKKRVLFIGEANFLLSGFGTYSKEVLKRLHKTGKYELAEFSSYCKHDDVQLRNSDWLIYANNPSGKDKKEEEIFKSNDINQFGLWRFDRVCLDFKPDIVVSYRDPWMDSFIAESPLRKYFNWVWMPTVDSAPQRPEWVTTYMSADAIFTYSEFGTRTLEEQGNGKINLQGCASPGIDPELYKPVIDKKQHRQAMGMPPDILVVGTVMRNQKRKLFPDLFQAFRKYLDTAPQDIAQRSYLYIHTSYPEKNGWDIPDLILENGLSGRVFCTYCCKVCKAVHVSFFKDARTLCPRCGNVSAVMPNVIFGPNQEDLVKIYNCFDVYVQYAICEGFGMPAVEAAACGVPIMCVDWTAMTDVAKNCSGKAIKVKHIFRELETGANRCYPDNDHLVELLINFFKRPDQIRKREGYLARKSCLSRYTWDQTASIWEDYLDGVVLKNKQGQWDAPPDIFNPNMQIPENLNTQQLVEWAMVNIANTPEEIFSFKGMNVVRDLNFGAAFGHGYIQEFNPEKFITHCKNYIENKNLLEKLRCGMLEINMPDFVKYAHGNLKK
jgi:glycosyltransferase involved in cell wall biosynthesis